MSLKFKVWQQGEDEAPEGTNAIRDGRWYYHGVSGGNITVPCSEADGYVTEKEAHRAVKRVWESFATAMCFTKKLGFPPVPYAKSSRLPRVKAQKA